MKVIVSEIRKTSKDYNSNSLGYTIEYETNQGEDAQQAIITIEKIIHNQFTRRGAEAEVSKVFSRQDSPQPSQPMGVPAAVRPQVNERQAPQETRPVGEFGIISPAQLTRLFAVAKKNFKWEELKNMYDNTPGLIVGKEKNNMTKAQYKTFEKFLGL